MSARALDIADLYAAERGRLKRLLARVLGNQATADDLVQQAFLKLMASAPRKELDNGPAYLTATARNLAFNHLRDARRRGEVGLADLDLHAIPDPRPSPEATIIHRSDLRLVLEAVASLPPRRREAFILSRFEGLTYDEIASRQQVSRNTVISQIALALAQLDRRLQPEDLSARLTEPRGLSVSRS